jgi:zinc protease
MKVLQTIFFLVIAGTLPLVSQTSQPTPIDPNIRYGKLNNGITYYIRHNEQPKERAEFYIAQNVGAILEEDSQNGLAHFLEHMCFNGTKHFPGNTLLNYFESVGVKFGQNINAYTSLDETVYNLSEIPTKTRDGIVDSALLALHDWSCNVLLEASEIDKERGVIREEWRQGRTAVRRLIQARNEVMFAGSQYAKRSIIGDTSVINNFSYDNLRAYYKKWYRPDLQAILIVGDIDVDQMEAKVKKLFSDIPAPTHPAKRIWYTLSDNKEPIIGVFTDPEMTSQQFLVFWKKPALPDSIRLSSQGYVLSCMNSLISAMTNERFSNITQEPGTPIAGAAAGIDALVRTSDAFIFQCSPVLGKEKEARSRLLKEIEIIRRHGFTEAEFERAKINILSGLEKAYKEKDQQKNGSLVDEYVRNFTEAEPIPGITWEYEATKNFIPGISLESVNQLASGYLTDENMVFTITGPQKEGLIYPTKDELLQEIDTARNSEVEAYKDTTDDKPLIPVLPKRGKVKKETFNKELGTTEWILSNGIKVIFKPTRFKDDEIRMTAYSDGGLSLYPEKDIMSATFATDVVNYSGIGQFNLTDLQKKLTGKIVSVDPNISNYEERMTGTSSVKDKETMLQLVYLYFTSVRKDKEACQLLLKQVETYLENTKGNPQKQYSDSVNLITYGYHPRVLPMNQQTIQQVDMESAYRIYSERFANPADFTFVFVGNIDPENFKPLIELYLGGMKTKKTREMWKDNGIRIQKGLIRKDIVRSLQVSKTTNNIRYSANIPYNLNNIVSINALADILDLRYTATLREEEGATYGVSVSGSLGNRPTTLGSLSIRFDTDPKVGEKMLNIIHGELDSIASRGPRAEDLNKVKLNSIKQLKEDLSENGWWMSTLLNYYRNNLDIVREYEKTIDALSIESMREFTKKLLQQENRLEILLQPSK